MFAVGKRWWEAITLLIPVWRRPRRRHVVGPGVRGLRWVLVCDVGRGLVAANLVMSAVQWVKGERGRKRFGRPGRSAEWKKGMLHLL